MVGALEDDKMAAFVEVERVVVDDSLAQSMVSAQVCQVGVVEGVSLRDAVLPNIRVAYSPFV